MAVLIFGMAAVGLARALNLMGTTALESSEAAWRDGVMRAYLTEWLHRPDLREGTFRTRLPEEGFELETRVERAEVRNGRGVVLNDLFRIEVILSRDGEEAATLETWRYGEIMSVGP